MIKSTGGFSLRRVSRLTGRDVSKASGKGSVPEVGQNSESTLEGEADFASDCTYSISFSHSLLCLCTLRKDLQ